MTPTIRTLIESLHQRGYEVLAYNAHNGTFRIAGILGWRDLQWVIRVTRRAA